MNNNIDIRMVEKNRANINKFGNAFGTGVFMPSREDVILNYNERKSNLSKFDLFVTRQINRYKLSLANITGINIETDAEGESIVMVSGIDATGKTINIPCSVDDPYFTKKPTVENLREAFENNKPAFFSSPRVLKDLINEINLKEKKRVDDLIKELQSISDNLGTTISDNSCKVDDYFKQLDAKTETNLHMHMTIEQN